MSDLDTVPCASCLGQADCWVCSGRGELVSRTAAPTGCRYCGSSGRCRGCAGTGQVPRQRAGSE